MKRILVFFLALCMFINLTSFGINASVITEEINLGKSTRLLEILNLKINELEKSTNEALNLSPSDSIDVSIISITTITDFSGNEYILAECSPTGYLIYHVESGIFAESSVLAPSPYLGITGEKYYCGPNEYYSKEYSDEEVYYKYTKNNEIITSENISSYIDVSEKINNAFINNANLSVVNYVNKNQPIRNNSVVASRSTPVFVDDSAFLIYLRNPGYLTINGEGICGYIAAAMLLSYDKWANNSNTVDAGTYTYQSDLNGYVIDEEFTEGLYQLGASLGYGTDTTSVAIHYTVQTYLNSRNISATHTSLYIPFATNSGIAEKIDNDRPVIWFGLVTNHNVEGENMNIKHAVLVYGYTGSFWGGYEFIAHFGWENATYVSFSGVLGSIYTYEIN